MSQAAYSREVYADADLAWTTRQLMPAWKTARHRCSKKNAGSSGM